MSAIQPDSFFAKPSSAADQLYLSDTNQEEFTYVEGAKPGIPLDLMPVPEHLRKIYGKFSDDPETRKKEIEALTEFISEPSEDKKCSPPAAKKPKLRLKMKEGESDNYRVKVNLEHGITKPAKQVKKPQMWDYVDQQLQKNLVIQILPLPTFDFRFSKKMSMEEVTASDVLKVLRRFLPPTTTTTKLLDIQTETLGEVKFRFVVVRKRIKSGSYSYALLPNLVISSNREVFQKAPTNVWYQKTTTADRDGEMTMPRPFKGNQSVRVLFENTFSWDV